MNLYAQIMADLAFTLGAPGYSSMWLFCGDKIALAGVYRRWFLHDWHV